MHTQHIHNINSYMVASVTQRFVWPYLFSSVFTYHCVKPQVSKNKHLAFTFLLIKNVIPSVSGPEMSLIISPVDSGEIFYEAEWILANLLSKAEWILASLLSKAEWILANDLSKAEWILANDLPSRVDSRKSCTKPSGFWRNRLRIRVDSRQTYISQTDSLQVFLLSKGLMSPVFSFVCWSLSQ